MAPSYTMTYTKIRRVTASPANHITINKRLAFEGSGRYATFVGRMFVVRPEDQMENASWYVLVPQAGGPSTACWAVRRTCPVPGDPTQKMS